ncbi:uncharacterized protein LOC123684831 [Harmonia axyridis]|uniref:uncharacterized protein LOC123684831 n=1 Tax=Harmonia axyridis TaxID=115357 RepID=UPI001E27836D|nr:uncharacterized protein LOC123684831 [Harmonia axyridis]
MSLNANHLSAFFGKFSTNPNILTTEASMKLLDRTHHSSSGHYGEGYHHQYSYSKKKKKSIAMNTLTLLSFLFFLNMLQNCIQEHINQMNPTTIVIQIQTTMATVRKMDLEGDDVGKILEIGTLNRSERVRNNDKNRNYEISSNVKGRKNTDGTKMKKKNIKRKTKPTTFSEENEYQYE